MIVPAQTQNLQVKPRWQAPVGVMEAVVAYNCRKYGFPRPVLALPMWEGAGNRVMDLSGHGNHGTLINGPKWTARGLDFVDDKIEEDFDSLPALPYTLSAWVKTTDIAAIQTALFVGDQDDKNSETMFGVSSAGFFFLAHNLDSTSFTESTVAADGEWHHLVVTVSSAGSAVLYIDSIYEATTPSHGWPRIDRYSIGRRGANYEMPDEFFDGLIDEVYIFNTDLSEGQVKFLYDNPYFMYRMPEELYGYAAAVGGRTAKLSRSTMNVHPGVMFQTLTGGHGY